MAYIGLGANLGDRRASLESALAAVGNLPNTAVLRCSSWYENPAVGIEGGPDFLNGVAEIKTRLPPKILLERLLAIELQHGRERLRGQGAKGYLSRTLDLDLLLYGDEAIVEAGLTVPHPRMMEREFVLKPLAELGIHFHPDKAVPKQQ